MKTMRDISKNYRTFAINNMNNCGDFESETANEPKTQCENESKTKCVNEPKIKSENEIQKIILDKKQEYVQLMMTQSPECEDLCNEINKLDSRLRASYGFSNDEDLTLFPVIKFEEPKIENPLD